MFLPLKIDTIRFSGNLRNDWREKITLIDPIASIKKHTIENENSGKFIEYIQTDSRKFFLNVRHGYADFELSSNRIKKINLLPILDNYIAVASRIIDIKKVTRIDLCVDAIDEGVSWLPRIYDINRVKNKAYFEHSKGCSITWANKVIRIYDKRLESLFRYKKESKNVSKEVRKELFEDIVIKDNDYYRFEIQLRGRISNFLYKFRDNDKKKQKFLKACLNVLKLDYNYRAPKNIDSLIYSKFNSYGEAFEFYKNYAGKNWRTKMRKFENTNIMYYEWREKYERFERAFKNSSL